MATKKKYSLTEEHRTQLGPWAEKWIRNAMSTEAMTEEDREICRAAVKRLYRAANLTPPPDHRIVFVPSPFVARFAAGFAAWIWYCRKNKIAATDAATSAATRDATRGATYAATSGATSGATYAATFDTTSAATSGATSGATYAATRAATDAATFDTTRDATYAATDAATSAATRAATDAATFDTTSGATYAATSGATRDATRDATRAATDAATFDATRAATDAATSAATRAATDAATYAATRDATRDATDAATFDATRDATDAATRDATRAATDAATRDATRAATDAATRDATRWFMIQGDMVRLAQELGVGQAGLQCAYNAYDFWQGGNQWSAWDSFLSFFRHVVRLDINYAVWDAWETLSLHSGPRTVHKEFCIISDRPDVLLVDEQNRPHCATGPCCRWRDGSALYSFHGTRAPAWIIEHPEKITAKRVLAEENAEVRRVMIERMGMERFLREAEAKKIHSHEMGDLFSIDLPNDPEGVLRAVRVKDQSTSRLYFLRVPPTIKRADDAVAWTFGFDATKDYKPVMET